MFIFHLLPFSCHALKHMSLYYFRPRGVKSFVYDMDEEKRIENAENFSKVPQLTGPEEIETKNVEKNVLGLMTDPDQISKEEFDVESQSSSIVLDVTGRKSNFKIDLESISQSEEEKEMIVKEEVDNLLHGVTTRQKYEFIEDSVENVYGWNLITPGVLEIINPTSEIVTIKRNIDGVKCISNFEDKVELCLNEGPKEVPFLTVEDNVMAVKFIVQYDSERMLPNTGENGENSKVQEIVEIPKEKSFTSIQTEQVSKKSFKKYFNFKKWKKRKTSIETDQKPKKPWFGFWL